MRLSLHVTFIILGLCFGLLVAEGIFRLCGVSVGVVPAPYEPAKFRYREPFTEDSETGWTLLPGSYELVLGKRERASKINVRPDGSRRTREENNEAKAKLPKIIFIGDSFIFGEGLDDDETLPWRLQQLIPQRNVLNFGVGGYGTCQTMLHLNQIKGSISSGDIVIYGLSGFHEERNTGDPRQDYWVALSSFNHQSGYPRCKLSNGEIVRDDSKVWHPLLPLTGRSVLSKIFTDIWLGVLALENNKSQRALMYSLLTRMKQLVEERSGTFIVLLQEISPDVANNYRNFLTSSKIPYVDGVTIADNAHLKLPDGHPGPGMDRLWAEELSKFLSR